MLSFKCGNSNRENFKVLYVGTVRGIRYRCRRFGRKWQIQNDFCYEIIPDKTREPFKRTGQRGRRVDVG